MSGPSPSAQRREQRVVGAERAVAGQVDEVRRAEQVDDAVGRRLGGRDHRRLLVRARQRRRSRRRRTAAPGRRRTPPAASRRGPARPAAAWLAVDHALSDGLTATGRARSGARRAPRHAVQGAGRHDDERPVGAGDRRRQEQVGERRRRLVQEQPAPRRGRRRTPGPGSAGGGRRRATSRCSSSAATSPRSWSDVRPPRATTAHSRPVEVGVGQQLAVAELADRLGDRLLGRRRLAALPAGPARQRPDLPLDAQALAIGGPARRRDRPPGRPPPRRAGAARSSSDAIAASSGARTSGARHTIVRIASMRCSSSRGRRSSIASRAPSSISSAPWWAACGARLQRAERRPAPRRPSRSPARHGPPGGGAVTGPLGQHRGDPTEHHLVGAAPTCDASEPTSASNARASSSRPCST